ncbi:acyl carrier protein [Burkholderia oklahomensis]|uniref:Phosphopantetheine attachment site family protein n=1 Tax=Burkholderia oklahomensis TaxID=342113 RepID=A0AAI8FNM9_9BURK|nr:phosphopantetheine-binding protein [Burkholderia oklahomensis]AIO67040.1 phosphopantetheine attachment site family protein [Burkholderia oklahomensis]AJX30629.1 phosphopantetheine attachment site family protein [Burkholderia oklahomensis C6786]AOI41647.1 coronafacic acid synthetase [Burkholderia oklahomensis EO147]AOI45233.1 coronafacic acid synthetase [Burkholderia oklahomensis C6786]KUY59536.1 coronafacic acid synthetase [Burkholderia oklahomensis C6786]
MQITDTQQQIVERLRDIVATRLDLDIKPEQIGLTDGFQSTIGIDSIGFIELRYQCEEAFGIKIDDDDFTPDNFSNCDALSRFLLTKLDA